LDSAGHGFRNTDEGLGIGHGKPDSALASPKVQPDLEVFRSEVEIRVLLNQWSGVFGFSSRDGGPEAKYFFEVVRPVVDLVQEDRPDDLVLAHIRIEMLQQRPKGFVSTNSLKKGRSEFDRGRCKRVWRGKGNGSEKTLRKGIRSG